MLNTTLPAILIFILLIAKTLSAEEAIRPLTAPAPNAKRAGAPLMPAAVHSQQKVAAIKARRRPASTGQNSLSTRKHDQGGNFEFRVSLAGGLMKATSGDSIAKELGAPDLEQNLTLLGNVDLVWKKIFALNLEVNYLMPATGANSVMTVDRNGNSIMLGAEGRLPIYLGRTLLLPRAGLGYGMLSESFTFKDNAGTDNMSLNQKGIYGLAGLSLIFPFGMEINADYSTSLSSSCNYDPISDAVVEGSNCKFSRLRVGTNFLITDSFYFGLLYVGRSTESQIPFDYGSGPTTQQNSSSLSQYLGLVGFRF